MTSEGSLELGVHDLTSWSGGQYSAASITYSKESTGIGVNNSIGAWGFIWHFGY